MFISPIMFARKPRIATIAPSVGILDDVFEDSEIKGLLRARYEMRKSRRRR
jgi:hypothetical protein